MRAALIFALLFAGCLEVIEHTPAGTCASDSDCPCGQDCSVTDAGFHFCGTRVTHSCIDDHDCASTGRPPHCLEQVRDGGGCGYLVCQ